MKSVLFSLCFVILTFSKAQTPSVTVSSSNGYTLTCANPTLYMSFSCNWTASANYSLVSSFAMSTGSNAAITTPGIYTVVANSGSVSSTQTIAVYINTVTPVSSVSPASQTIMCRGVTPVTAYANLPSNITHHFSPPSGTPFSSTLSPATYTPGAIGVFTHTAINTINGCFSTNTFTVILGQVNTPIINVTSAENFTLGCNTRSIATVSTTTLTPGGPFTYSVLAPGSSSTLLPTGPLAINSTFSLTAPGTWTYVMRDTNTCTFYLPLTILSYTNSPEYMPFSFYSLCSPASITIAPQPSATLNPSFVNNYNFVWFSSSASSVVATAISSVVTINSQAHYTVQITNPTNDCKTISVISPAACVGLNEAHADIKPIVFYPNPGSGLFYLHTSNISTDITIDIYNNLGQLIKTQMCLPEDAIDLEAESNGVYFIRLKQNDKVIYSANLLKQ